MRFLIDENLPFSLVQSLRASHDVFDVATSTLRGATDKKIWLHAGAEQRILVTRDLDFPLSGSEIKPAGLVLIRVPESYTALQITQLFSKVMEDIAVLPFENHITVITPTKVRVRRLS
ncbi:MAG: DUF5615 family PIN-like protein [Gammaproteobacteria bacterium]|nr:DUF5615 family PIN-like protein [Gammaproteobacteria bacterium]